jgi:hypothetical protein
MPHEELVAEMGSAFLCAALGIMPTVRHADYIGNWLEVLKDDSRAIVSSAQKETVESNGPPKSMRRFHGPILGQLISDSRESGRLGLIYRRTGRSQKGTHPG